MSDLSHVLLPICFKSILAVRILPNEHTFVKRWSVNNSEKNLTNDLCFTFFCNPTCQIYTNGFGIVLVSVPDYTVNLTRHEIFS